MPTFPFTECWYSSHNEVGGGGASEKSISYCKKCQKNQCHHLCNHLYAVFHSIAKSHHLFWNFCNCGTWITLRGAKVAFKRTFEKGVIQNVGKNMCDGAVTPLPFFFNIFVHNKMYTHTRLLFESWSSHPNPYLDRIWFSPENISLLFS